MFENTCCRRCFLVRKTKLKWYWLLCLLFTCCILGRFILTFTTKDIGSYFDMAKEINKSFYEESSQMTLHVDETERSTTLGPSTLHVDEKERSTTLGPSTTQQPLNDKGVHELSREEPYYRRLTHIQDQCKSKAKQTYNIRLFHYKFSDKLKLIMCETPKAASTTLQDRMALMDPSYQKSHPKDFTCGERGNNCFKRISQQDAWKKIANFTSFLTTRHPWDRLVSGYLNKFRTEPRPFYRHTVGITAARMLAGQYLHGIEYRNDLVKMNRTEIESLPNFANLSSSQQSEVLEYIESMKTGRISFQVFVKYLVNQYNRSKAHVLDHHWRAQVLVCQPCAFDYSYIMRFEDLSVDSDRLFDFIFDQQDLDVSKESVKIPLKPPMVSGSQVAQHYFDKIPEAEVQILRKLYKDDFEFYNYDPYIYHGYT